MAIIPSNEKVFMVSNSTNTVYGGSAAMQAMTKWYTMEDVTNTVRPYQVFTALLTQSGGDNPLGNCSDDPHPLIIGVTYTISVADGTADFTNVGAPNNNLGTSFVATGTIPNSWGTSGDNCLDYNTGAPVATVLENTIGNIWFEYTPGQPGTYFIGNDLPYPGLYSPKSWGISGPAGIIGSDTKYFVTIQESQVRIGFGDDEVYEGKLNSTPIEIRVYN